MIIKSVCSISFDPRGFQLLEETFDIDEVQITFRLRRIQNILVDPVPFPKSKCLTSADKTPHHSVNGVIGAGAWIQYRGYIGKLWE